MVLVVSHNYTKRYLLQLFFLDGANELNPINQWFVK